MELNWFPWRPLTTCWSDRQLASPGLYRIRRAGREEIDYIGQTGGPLIVRLQALKRIDQKEMPYRDPHTVGPALWAQQQLTNEPYEASTCSIESDLRWRRALEAIATALYRQEHGRSPTFNFGRMPSGYRMSSGNNQKLVAAGKRFRGEPCSDPQECHLPSLAPVGPLTQDFAADDWCGHSWSPWTPLDGSVNVLGKPDLGLYRIRSHTGELLYVGEGRIRGRLKQHAKQTQAGNSPQGQVFAAASPFSCSWVINPPWHSHQRLEMETDLIAAYALAEGQAPAGQFIR